MRKVSLLSAFAFLLAVVAGAAAQQASSYRRVAVVGFRNLGEDKKTD